MNRTAGSGSTQQIGSLLIDHYSHEVSLDGHLIHMTHSEFTLLTTLTGSPRRAFSNDYLTQILQLNNLTNESHALKVIVSRLRRKLGESGRQPQRVMTVHGYGYRFESEPVSDPASILAADAPALHCDHEPISAFVMVDFDRRISWASDSIEQLIAWRPIDLVDRILYDLIHPDDRDYAKAFRNELDEGNAVAMTLRWLTASGHYTRLEARARPVVGPDGTTTAFLGELRATKNDLDTWNTTPQAIHMQTQNH